MIIVLKLSDIFIKKLLKLKISPLYFQHISIHQIHPFLNVLKIKFFSQTVGNIKLWNVKTTFKQSYDI